MTHLITRNADYAIRALAVMCRHHTRNWSVPDLVHELGIPRPFLRTILQTLTRHGILASRKGIGGGFRVVRSPRKISVVDIIEIFQGPFAINECLFKRQICPNTNRCLLKKKIDTLERYVARQLGAITIADLIR